MDVATARREKAQSFTSRTSLTTADDDCGVRQFSSTSLDALGKTLDNQNLVKQAQGQSFGGPSWLKAGRRAGFEGLRQTSHSAGALALPPPFLFLCLLVHFFFNAPFVNTRPIWIKNYLTVYLSDSHPLSANQV